MTSIDERKWMFLQSQAKFTELADEEHIHFGVLFSSKLTNNI